MIISTVFLILLLLLLAPIRLNIGVELVPSDIMLKVKVRTRFLSVFEERFLVQQGMIIASGTISDCLKLTDLDFNGGLDLTKCITVDRLDVGICPSVCGSPVEMTAYNLASSLIGTAALFTHTQLNAVTLPTCDKSRICLAAKVSSNLTEILAYLVGQLTKK